MEDQIASEVRVTSGTECGCGSLLSVLLTLTLGKLLPTLGWADIRKFANGISSIRS